MPGKRRRKAFLKKTVIKKVAMFSPWTIVRGELTRGKGRPSNETGLFKVVAEKIPFKCLDKVRDDHKKNKFPRKGIYVAHDSMGVARYVGRGYIFSRLAARKNAFPLELKYFSFYIVESDKHERELETLVIRTSSHLLEFNEKKKRTSIEAGNIRDYEAGTCFYERQRTKGKPRTKAKTRRPSRIVRAS